MRFGPAIFAAAFAVASAADAQPELPEPERPRLRLDESPDLALLAPFRHASDPGRRAVMRWRSSPWGSWVRRNLHDLDWEAGYADRSRGTEAPISPNVAHSDRPVCETRLTEVEPRWPYVVPREHWFEDAAAAPWPLEPLEVSTDLVPPWLARVDVHWAHVLLLAAGCGRGGSCSAGVTFPASAFMELWDALSPAEQQPWWECRERPLPVFTFGPERETFVVLHCDGSVPDGALEKLSILARPPGTERPEELPQVVVNGEWAENIKVMHPRLLWVLHQIALEWPWRAVHIYSGYRPAQGPLNPASHGSNHALGRALDLRVLGVDNEELLALCHTLSDIGCGYYPNGKFVHFDIRFRGRGLWVDASAPGTPSRYVDGWPGVVEHGRVIWKKPT